jgi:hypothetical protein
VESEKDAAAEELGDGGAELRKAIGGVGSLGLEVGEVVERMVR